MRDLPTGSVLACIVDTKRAELDKAQAEAPLDTWVDTLADLPPPRDFAAALKRGPGDPVRVIAEVKKASPSKGVIRADFDPVAIARAYVEGGAAALSVLTDRDYFQGDLAYLDAVRAAVDVPLLRKDFTIDPYHVYEARRHGADAILLIAAVLDDGELNSLADLAASLGLAALVEAHTEAEVERAVAAGAGLVGINNRDLATFDTTLETTFRLLSRIPESRVRVSESGIESRAQVKRLEAAGLDAVLVGESLMRKPDVGAALRALLGR
jgi:indole-3-glycerol phosphate synthase